MVHEPPETGPQNPVLGDPAPQGPIVSDDCGRAADPRCGARAAAEALGRHLFLWTMTRIDEEEAADACLPHIYAFPPRQAERDLSIPDQRRRLGLLPEQGWTLVSAT